jgi:hypothetical protein
MAVATIVASTAEIKIAANAATKIHVRREPELFAGGVGMAELEEGKAIWALLSLFILR